MYYTDTVFKILFIFTVLINYIMNQKEFITAPKTVAITSSDVVDKPSVCGALYILPMKGNNYSYKLPDIKELKHLYFEDKMSANDIAKKYGVTMGAVLIKFRRLDIKRRSMSESQGLIANYIELTPEFTFFINGLLLGDGCVVFAKDKKSCWYGHSDKNKEYLEWLKKCFNSFGIKCSDIKPHTNNTWSMKTMSYRNFVEIRNVWYPEGRKVIPKIELTPITLFNWYIGDGNYDKKSRSKKVVICSQFDQAGKVQLSEQIGKLGINNNVYSNCIYILMDSRKLFFDYILNHKYSIPDSYKYKF